VTTRRVFHEHAARMEAFAFEHVNPVAIEVWKDVFKLCSLQRDCVAAPSPESVCIHPGSNRLLIGYQATQPQRVYRTFLPTAAQCPSRNASNCLKLDLSVADLPDFTTVCTRMKNSHNARLDDETYHRRSVVESVIRSLKQRFADTLRART
jgi:hypothetical protein